MILAFAENSIQLVPDGTLLLHIAVILVMVWVLNKTLFRPVNRVLEEREHRTRGRSDEAQNVLRQVEKKLTQYEHSLRDARSASYQFLERERLEATRSRQDKLDIVREEINQLVVEQKTTIQAEASEARVRLDEEARRLAMTVSAQILKRPLNNLSQSGTYN
jgi:F-type H+-transporting ATPase subunit b